MNTQHINLLALVEAVSPMKRKTTGANTEYAGSCPFCGGEDRFIVWPNRPQPTFWCRGCDRKGDAIQFVMWTQNVTFWEACEHLGLRRDRRNNVRSRPKSVYQPTEAAHPKSLGDDYLALNDDAWQCGARSFVAQAAQILETCAGRQARDYLARRHISYEVAIEAGLGYNAHGRFEYWGDTRVWLPAGLVIPWHINHRIWRINVRNLNPDLDFRYRQVKGGANGLYGTDYLQLYSTVLVTEGEFDALVARTVLGKVIPNFAAVATGSASGARLLRWVVLLQLASTVLLAFDADDAGDAAAIWWAKQLGSKAVRLRPTRHDLSDMAVAGDDMLMWANSVVAVTP